MLHHVLLWGLPVLIVLGLVIWAAIRNAARHAQILQAMEAQQALLREQNRMLERIAIAQEARK
jgi:cytochrome c-type biogenesis protein CcmH/NrfF